MAEPVESFSWSPDRADNQRRDRRRVAALLNTHYRIEHDHKQLSETPVTSDLDRQSFDAQRYFDSMVASGQLQELMKTKTDLESQVSSLDGGMQRLVFENYNKFIRATDIIKQMKFTIEGLDPDLKCLEGHIGKLDVNQHVAEDGVCGRARQIESLLKQQRVCKKLQVLFGLPTTLKRCLDSGNFGQAVQAYCCCAGVLRQYRDMPIFQKVLEDVDQQMGRIRSALESRLRSPELSVDEAVNSSMTLLDLREDQNRVATEYLTGRAAMLQQSLDRCFMPLQKKVGLEPEHVLPEGAVLNGGDGVAGAKSPSPSSDQVELEQPESMKLRTACIRATDNYVRHLCDAVEGFQKLQDFRSAAGDGQATTTSIDATILLTFVELRVKEVCKQISEVVEEKCPPARVLVSCIHFLRDCFKRLHGMVPRLLTKLFMDFMSRMALSAMKAIFQVASAHLVAELCRLHDQCKRLQESKDSGLDDVLEEIAKTEQSLLMHGFQALVDCQPLLHLLGSDRPSCQQLMRGLHEQLITFFVAFVLTCHTYIGREPPSTWNLETSFDGGVSMQLDEAANLDWSGLFGLALVRIGRHLESKAINKVWAVANELFVDGETIDCALQPPPPGVITATRLAAEAMITHYVMVSGQRLAHFFRNSVQSRNWMTVREPRDPRLVVEMVLKEVQAFSAQLSKILGDQQKLTTGHQRRTLSRFKSGMELEMERLWAKKLLVFDRIPFNRNRALVGILRIAFKALYEYMRDETFSKFGLQQIQVDCAFLQEAARDFVAAEDASTLEHLLDEVLNSATQRCNDPIKMEPEKVEAICDEKKKKMTSFKFE